MESGMEVLELTRRAQGEWVGLICMAEQAVWVFGYGSLLWRQEFSYEENVVGQLKGCVRRFWQASFIHRGTKEKVHFKTLPVDEKYYKNV